MCLIAVGVRSRRIAVAEAATGTGLPLTFICTEALPSVSNSLRDFSVGIV
jgi:hypothetical protein